MKASKLSASMHVPKGLGCRVYGAPEEKDAASELSAQAFSDMMQTAAAADLHHGLSVCVADGTANLSAWLEDPNPLRKPPCTDTVY